MKFKNVLKKGRLRTISVCIILILFLGFTYAYVAPFVSDIVKTQIYGVGSQVDQLVFYEGDPLILSPGNDNLNIGDGNLTSQTIAKAKLLTNNETKTATMNYSLYIDITLNEYIYTTDNLTPEIILTIIDPNGNEIKTLDNLEYYDDVYGLSGFDVTAFEGIISIVNDYEITGSIEKIDEWIVKLSMVNLPTDQSLNAMKTITGEIIFSKDVYVKPGDINIIALAESGYKNLATMTNLSCTGSNNYSWNYLYNSIDINNLGETVNCTINQYNNSVSTNLNDYILNETGYLINQYTTEKYPINYETVGKSYFSSVSTDIENAFTYTESKQKWQSSKEETSYLMLTAPETGYININSKITNYVEGTMVKIYLNNNLKFTVKKDGIYENFLEVSSGDVIKIEYSSVDSSYLEIDFEYTNEIDYLYAGKRYYGTEPDNYIMFNGEMWRIIGVLDTETESGEIKSLTKIIREDSLGTFSYDNNNANDWENSSLYSLLNNDYYNSINSTNNGSSDDYCWSYIDARGDCDFTSSGINSAYHDFIETVVWKLGSVENEDQITNDWYIDENLNNSIYSNRVISKIGLMSMSDYGYASFSYNRCDISTAFLSYFYSNNCGYSSWLFNGAQEWTLTPNAYLDYMVFYIENVGDSIDYDLSENLTKGSSVRPSLYLKEEVLINSGSGTIDDPYTIVMEV